jgi:putative Holliday junction resolvase
MSQTSGRVLGLDLGESRIGVALSDPDRKIALPLGTVHVGQPPGEMQRIAWLVGEHGATLVVLGHPLSMSGQRGTAAHKAEEFARALEASLDVPVVLHDERLSTVEADRSLDEAGVPSKDRRSMVDSTAATVILQSWLDQNAPG